MTNAEKFFKDGVDVEEFLNAIPRGEITAWISSRGTCISMEGLKEWLNTPAKPTLSEDEKVILRKLPEKYMYIGRRDGTPSIELYIKSDDDFKHCWCFYNHLFQFIKERRRI